MTKDEALKLALSTLNEVRQETFRLSRDGQKLYAEDKVWSTIISIKEALAKEKALQALHDENERLGLYKDAYAEQEPVAWEQFHEHMAGPNYVAPQRTWVGLTAKEKHEFRYSHMTTADFIEDIEAKLKDKNTRGQE